MKITTLCNKVIEYSFYALFLLVPLVFSGKTSELFELNKIWLTYGLTVLIGAAWVTNMIARKQISIQRTPLDIPIGLFLASQIISTIISLDSHVSFWGYYSRFNGGLLSTLCYILLYYAFVSTFPGIIHKIHETVRNKHLPIINTSAIVVRRVLVTSLFAGLGVAIWGIPSHFGSDPTCLIFRGTFDTSCWTEAFKPTIRAFSTLGQPAWLAAYVAVLIPIALAFFLTKFVRKTDRNQRRYVASFVLAVTFYLCLIFANTRAGYIAFGIADVLFWGGLYMKHLLTSQTFLRYFIVFHVIFLLSNFLFGAPINMLNKFTLPEITKSQPAQPSVTQPETAPGASVNITDSGEIRLLVWQGAFDAWKKNPLIGTGVETFAYAYYQYKPLAHNATSEWDYLYNKAHNEYLNYLATTGIFGLGSYLTIIVGFLFVAIKKLIKRSEQASIEEVSKNDQILILGMLCGYLSLLISNFFGFSVVIINLYFFLIPAFVFVLGGMLNPEKRFVYTFGEEAATPKTWEDINPYQWTFIVVVVLLASYFLITLARSWTADTNYSTGSNLNRVGNYQQAYPLLLSAAQTVPDEPVYQDELVTNLGTLATTLYLNKDATNGAELAKQAIALDNQLMINHPNNIVFWKNRVRLFYTLAQGDPANKTKYFGEALKAITQAKKLAPKDAKIAYNLAIMYNENGQKDKAIEEAKRTIELKPDYRDAHVALGLFYHEKSVDSKGNIIDQALHKKAIETYENILKTVNSGDKEVKDTLDKWKKE